MRRAAILAVVVGLVLTAAVGGEEAASTPSRKTVVVGEGYAAGAFHRFWLGGGYRDLWTLPIELEVLDLQRYAGGLRPVMRVGGQQTLGLALKGADGLDYTFRGAEKDPSPLLPEYLQGTFAEKLLRDQISSQHPTGFLVAAPLMEALGIPHTTPRPVVMPDDPALGEFRAAFANAIGSIEVYPQPGPDGTPGFGGATEILSGNDFWSRADASPRDRADARAFLTARLLDLVIGDWDRHRKQWRWMRVPGKEGWQPLPEDRDQAFSRYDGLLGVIARNVQPVLLNYGGDYPGLEGLTYHGWEQDHWILAELERPAWDEVTAFVKGRLTDEVIERALRAMPPAYFEREAPRLRAALRQRRDRLPEAADRFYRRLAQRVTIRGTDEPEQVEVTRSAGGDLEVRVSRAAGSGASPVEPYFRRRFRAGETEEVRIDLRGGNDRAVVRGGGGGIALRVLGGPGADVLEDSEAGGTRFADSSGAGSVQRGPGTKWDRREYVPPPANPRAPWIPPRDWGRRSMAGAVATFGADKGLHLGGRWTTTGFGFRQDPYASRQVVEGGYAFKAGAVVFDYAGEFRRESSRSFDTLHARASGIDLLRFYGLGNETPEDLPDELVRVRQMQYRLSPSHTFGISKQAGITVGALARYTTTDPDDVNVVTLSEPYGSGDFGTVGVWTAVQWDGRDHVVFPRQGARFTLSGAYYPEVWDVESAYGEVRGEAVAYWGARSGALKPTLAFRVAGKRLFGTYPFQDAAFIGGGASVRGFRQNRFAGDASLYGSVELRLSVAKFFWVIPQEWGVFGLADSGRVWVEAESSRRWHRAFGGGVWMSFLTPDYTFAVSVARSDEGRIGVDFGLGFAF